MPLPLQNVDDVINQYSGKSHQVLVYCQLMKALVDQAKQPGFSEESWAPLAELIETKDFQRIGNFKEEMDWSGYVAFLTGWAMGSEWECSFKRITEVGNTVFLELEERSVMGGFSSSVNSFSVYEFNANGKVQHVDVYLQMELPDPGMLSNYEGVI
ncbi:hypothetical protein [Halioxenophilus sp. WMMB6]|uniref:hypothetical protein n=1 Tax=Halioxenophilus sp. WMMB6 TaxID=3073815 RepID=UPI00295E6E07|nr:hypothetical protein [Halioxenophilus sp. WMMB6]